METGTGCDAGDEITGPKYERYTILKAIITMDLRWRKSMLLDAGVVGLNS